MLTRRRFLQVATAGALSLTALRTRADSPHERIRVGMIGTGVRGKYLIANLPPNVTVGAICDCAAIRIASVMEPKGEFANILSHFTQTDAAESATYLDYRRLLDRAKAKDKLDAVIIATPDHHHALPAILAMQAGLDVYLEKPLTVTIREGRLLTNAVKRTGRVLQVGSQQRTMEVNRIACEFIRNGGLGKITKVELPNYPGPLAMPSLDAEPAFGGVDFDLFCGPAPLRPHHRYLWMKEDFKVGNLLWRGWDLLRDYSGHLMTNWGAHSVDMVQLALGRDESGPVEVRALEPASVTDLWPHWKTKTPAPEGRAGNLTSDRRFWPVTMKYADGIELHFAPWNATRAENLPSGPDFIVFHGEKGRLKMRRNDFETDPPGLIDSGIDAAAVDKWKGGGHVARPHLENWLDAIRNGIPLTAPVEVGHRTVTICHLANITRELNRPLRWHPETEQFIGDHEANQLLERPRRQGFELPQV
jgi:predicted dehydrogenase